MADKKYETGIETRKLILAECRKLFLDKGFHETSYNDICKAAHVNRGSIYYHFKQKDMIRYEILWEIYTDNKRFAEQYTSVSSHQYVFALYLMWRQILTLLPRHWRGVTTGLLLHAGIQLSTYLASLHR